MEKKIGKLITNLSSSRSTQLPNVKQDQGGEWKIINNKIQLSALKINNIVQLGKN